MSKHRCPRCGYETNFGTNFKKHLTLKNICNPIIADIPLDDLIDEFFSKKKNNKHQCEICNKKYASRTTLNKHLRTQHKKEETYTEKDTCIINKLVLDFQTQNTIVNQLVLDIQNLKQENETMKVQLRILQEKRNELFYQSILEKYYNASHKTLPLGITDITTEDAHIEIKNWDSWKEALSQLQIYNDCDPKQYLRVCFFGKCTEKQKEKVYICMKKYNLELYEFIEDQFNILLKSLDTNDIQTVYNKISSN